MKEGSTWVNCALSRVFFALYTEYELRFVAARVVMACSHVRMRESSVSRVLSRTLRILTVMLCTASTSNARALLDDWSNCATSCDWVGSSVSTGTVGNCDMCMLICDSAGPGGSKEVGEVSQVCMYL